MKTTLEEIVGSQSSLRVYSITKISKHPENVKSVHGKSVEFECKVEVNPLLAPAASISWFKDGKLVSARNALSSVLPLESVTENDSGKYSCKIITKVGEVSTSAELFVKKKTIISTQALKGDELEGESLSLNCDCEPDSDLAGNIRVTWFKDGKLLEGESKREIFLNDLKYDDTGDYKCLIKTELDEAEQIHTLVVYKKTAVEVPEVFADKKSVKGKEVEL